MRQRQLNKLLQAEKPLAGFYLFWRMIEGKAEFEVEGGYGTK